MLFIFCTLFQNNKTPNFFRKDRHLELEMILCQEKSMKVKVLELGFPGDEKASPKGGTVSGFIGIC
jgi:hypothetical protein